MVAGAMTGETGRHILVLNCGSSSLKFALFDGDDQTLEAVVCGEVASIGKSGSTFAARTACGRTVSETTHFMDQGHVIGRVLSLFKAWSLPAPAAIGHRIVHGGPHLRQHCLIDEEVLKRLRAAVPFAPLHLPDAIKVIGASGQAFPDALQAAAFDTTFHRSMPDVARILPIPRELEEQGVFRYGFHGLSCESILRQLEDPRPDRLIIAHLGSGASVTAVKAGLSIDTSMGLTPTGGVMMSARSGDIDPGVLLYLMREKHFNAARLEELVDRRSGLLGVSGLSSDMRDLHAASATTPRARLAIDMFAYLVRKAVASMIGVLGGLDALVFTGGVGENDAAVRAAVCEGLSCMGVDLDLERNSKLENPVNRITAACRILALPSKEDEQISRHTRVLMLAGRS